MYARRRRHEFQGEIDALACNPQVRTLLRAALLAAGTGFVAVARVTGERWVACAVRDELGLGLGPGDELSAETMLGHEVHRTGRERALDDPAPPGAEPPERAPGLRGCLSVPVRRADGALFGTLCALDIAPRPAPDARQRALFRLVAQLIGEAIDADAALQASRREAEAERRAVLAQERCVAILAHDLRNPIAALDAGLRRLTAVAGEGEDAAALIGLMRASVARMSGLIENLVEQARQRAEGGVVLRRDPRTPLGGILAAVVAEAQVAAPGRQIEARLTLPEPVDCDGPRLAQLLANLLGNALRHGAPDQPVTVEARLAQPPGPRTGELVLAVTNGGPPIPEDRLARLFQPFQRGEARDAAGLGLGLHIAGEIARAHGGRIEASSGAGRTRFALHMPLAGAVAETAHKPLASRRPAAP